MPFSEVVGHARPLGLLSRSIARGALPPSLLFTGPDGVGKSLVARAVAQVLNCLAVWRDGGLPHRATATPGGDEGLGLDACGTCAACRRIGQGRHPDVLLVEAAELGPIKIEQVREVVVAAAYRPFEGRRRVVIVDEAERLNADAQNALLKNLEEPPASSVFILVTARPDTLLTTVRSRCSRLRFGRLATADVARLLVERHDYEAADAYATAAVSGGSPGYALEAGSRSFRDAREAALAFLLAAARGTTPRSRLQGAGALLAGKASAAGEREEVATRVGLLAALLRDVAALAAGVEADRLANGDLEGHLSELAASFGGERALRAFAAADKAVAALRSNANPKIVADWLAMSL